MEHTRNTRGVSGGRQRGCRLLVGASLIACGTLLVWSDGVESKEKRRERGKQPEATPIATNAGEATRLGASVADSHPLQPALKMARQSREQLASVRDYSARFVKREMVRGRQVQQTMDMKLREEPFSVYLQYVSPHAGREVIYVEGANQGKLLAHERGIRSLAGTVALAPTSNEAMAESRYPITAIGMAKMLDTIIAQWERELHVPDVKVRYFPNAKIGTVETKMIETSHAQQRENVTFHMTRVYFDKQSNLPIRVEQFGWPTTAGGQPPLIEEYNYTNVRVNVGLTDIDFDTRNPAYSF